MIFTWMEKYWKSCLLKGSRLQNLNLLHLSIMLWSFLIQIKIHCGLTNALTVIGGKIMVNSTNWVAVKTIWINTKCQNFWKLQWKEWNLLKFLKSNAEIWACFNMGMIFNSWKIYGPKTNIFHLTKFSLLSGCITLWKEGIVLIWTSNKRLKNQKERKYLQLNF